jgi:hypothetical protein
MQAKALMASSIETGKSSRITSVQAQIRKLEKQVSVLKKNLERNGSSSTHHRVPRQREESQIDEGRISSGAILNREVKAFDQTDTNGAELKYAGSLHWTAVLNDVCALRLWPFSANVLIKLGLLH